MADRLERVAEEEAGPLQGSEQVADHREAAALDAREEEGRAPGAIDAPLDLGHLEIRVDQGVDAHEVLMAFQVANALL